MARIPFRAVLAWKKLLELALEYLENLRQNSVGHAVPTLYLAYIDDYVVLAPRATTEG